MNRREFLKGTAWMGAAAFAAGCQLNRLGFGEGGQMQNYVYRKLMGKRIRVGFIGIGSRGTGAVHRVSMIPGVDIVALCDAKQERVDENLKWLRDQKYAGVDKIKTYVGDEAYKDLCDFGDCDVVYCATPWALHQPVGLRGLLGGKIALIEVTSALTVDECWELVEASEKFQIPCMQLENCVYNGVELLELNLARLGMLGEINHAEGAYIHDLREIIPSDGKRNREAEWRYQENMKHKGDRYPTHGLVPLCQTMGINRGDRFDYLVSLDSGFHNSNYERFKKEFMTADDPRKFDPPADMGEMTSTLIKTVKGKSILLQHDVSSPRPYSRIQLISGTKGVVVGFPEFHCALEGKCFDGKAHNWFDEKATKEIQDKYVHPLWRDWGETAKRVGGHGGMDFIMDLRWAYCLQNGLPLDMDVYDLAATSCLCELTETSVRGGSKPVSVPDFTRGNWRNVEPWGVVNIDPDKMRLNFVTKDDAALNV